MPAKSYKRVQMVQVTNRSRIEPLSRKAGGVR